LALAIPAATGMIFNTLYNLTDYWFAGMLSDDALAGVSIAGSVFFLVLSASIGMQTGTTAMVAAEVGSGQTTSVGKWVDHANGLGIAFAILCTMTGLFFADSLISFLGAEQNIHPYAKRYVVIVLLGCFTFVLGGVAAGALIALGDTVSNRNALAAGLLANFILNPLFIFAFKLNVAGLALATIIIKAGTAWYLYYILKQKLGRWTKPAIDLQHWKALLAQVLPASFNMFTVILGGFITVAFVGRFGSQHVAGYSVGLRLEQLLLLPALGLNSAVMALVGQNYGANYPQRVLDTYKAALLTGLFISAISIPVMVFYSPVLLGLFSSNPEVIDTGATYLRIDALAFFAYVVLFVSVASLQAIKKPIFPMYLGIARQLVLPVAINYVLIVVLDLPMIYLFISVVIIVLGSAVVSHWYTWKQLKRLTNYQTGTAT